MTMDKDHNLSKPFSARGTWWVPGNEEEKIPGTIHYNPGERLQLELDGSFPLSEENSQGRSFFRAPLVVGTTKKRN